jgi:two-component system sensor histidine kinase/response regulator
MEQAESKGTILVVDDNAQNRALAQATLEDEGYRVLLASNGEAGVHLVETESPECVLLDVNMPGMNGLATCERIRALPSGPTTSIVFLTALRDLDTFDEALRVGGDDFLTKPIHPTVLALRVEAAMKLRRMGSELREYYDVVRHQRDELLRLQLQKERLTSFVVHDLKNPVNAIDLYAQVLARNGELSPSARGSVQQIRNEVKSLTRLILNLLDIGKGEEGRLIPQLAPTDLRQLSSEVLEALSARAEHAHVTLVSKITL